MFSSELSTPTGSAANNSRLFPTVQAPDSASLISEDPRPQIACVLPGDSNYEFLSKQPMQTDYRLLDMILDNEAVGKIDNKIYIFVLKSTELTSIPSIREQNRLSKPMLPAQRKARTGGAKEMKSFE